MHSWTATCSCGGCTMRYRTLTPPEDIQRGLCDCSLCTKTGAWFPLGGDGDVKLLDPAPLRAMALGDNPCASEILCEVCGDYLGSVLATRGGELRIALNGRLLDDARFVSPSRRIALHSDTASDGVIAKSFPTYRVT